MLHLITDDRGLPLVAEITAGQVSEFTQVECLMDGVAVPQRLGPPGRRPKRLAGDKAYSVRNVRDWLRAHGIWPLIACKIHERAYHEDRKRLDTEAYRRCAVAGHGPGQSKEYQGPGRRLDKGAIIVLAMVNLAIVRRYVKCRLSGARYSDFEILA